MAKQVIINLIDDYDGVSVADGTVEFSFEGVDYEIDLCEGNAEKLRAVLLPWIEMSRKATYFDDDEEENCEQDGVEPAAPVGVRWTDRNIVFPRDSSGAPFGSRYTPGLEVHGGDMWCLFVRKSDNRLYYARGNQEVWGAPRLFSGDSAPTVVSAPQLTEVAGVLHAVFSEYSSGRIDLVHYRYDDAAGEWAYRCGSAQHTAAAPALAAHEGRLFCAYVADGPSKELLFTTWDEYHGWSRPMSCGGESGWGAPALFVLGDELHLLFASNDQGREIVDMAYSEPEGPGSGTWTRTVHQPNEFANAGVAAAGSATNGHLGFLRRDAGNLLVSTLGPNGWSGNEVPGAYAWEAPAVVVHDGFVNLIFNARNEMSDLLWLEYPVPQLQSVF